MTERHGGQDIYDNLDALIEDFSTTTNYLGPVPNAIKHIQQKCHLITHYPKDDQQPYKQNLINFLFEGMTNDTNNYITTNDITTNDITTIHRTNTLINPNIILGNGASELIELVIRVSNKTTYFANDTQYKEYERACINNGLTKKSFEEANMVCIVNPCNPTGEYLSIDKLINYIKPKKNATILIDESMQVWNGADFRKDSMLSQYEFIQTMLKENNCSIYIIHSWTKIFSCTGIRIGSILCPDTPSCEKIQHLQNPWTCNILALEYLNECIHKNNRDYLCETWNTVPNMRKEQCEVIQLMFPQWKIYGANFLSWYWIELPNEETAYTVYLISKNNNMPIRWGKTGYNKPTFIRVAVRSNDNFIKLIDIWKKYLYHNSIIKKMCITDLKCHEQIDVDRAENLYEYLRENKTIPIIIADKDSKSIIDGHHRLYAFKKLNIENVDVLCIDYNQDEIIVHPNKNISKDEVVNSGLTGELMPPKSTQHMVLINGTLYPIIHLSTNISI